jgi:hypothetical protein
MTVCELPRGPESRPALRGAPESGQVLAGRQGAPQQAHSGNQAGCPRTVLTVPQFRVQLWAQVNAARGVTAPSGSTRQEFEAHVFAAERIFT